MPAPNIFTKPNIVARSFNPDPQNAALHFALAAMLRQQERWDDAFDEITPPPSSCRISLRTTAAWPIFSIAWMIARTRSPRRAPR